MFSYNVKNGVSYTLKTLPPCSPNKYRSVFGKKVGRISFSVCQKKASTGAIVWSEETYSGWPMGVWEKNPYIKIYCF